MSRIPENTAEIKAGDLYARVENGEVRSFCSGEHEFIHDPASPGWGHSDAEMFPIIGPTKDFGYRVQVPRGNAIQDQHGLLRELDYTIEEQSETRLLLRKVYQSGTPVPNSKYPDRSTARLLIWPYSFSFTKEITIGPDSLSVDFTVRGERDMPYMLGYHPAFRTAGPGAFATAGEDTISLETIMECGNRAMEIRDCENLALHAGRELEIHTKGFGHFMLWSPDPGMLCIEPVTVYPYSLSQGQLHEGFRYLGDDPVRFTVEFRVK